VVFLENKGAQMIMVFGMGLFSLSHVLCSKAGLLVAFVGNKGVNLDPFYIQITHSFAYPILISVPD
jgi:hypothetical protein